MLPERPYLKPWYRLVDEGDRVLLEYGQRVTILEGRATRRLLPSLLPLLDGTRTLAEIESALGEVAAPGVRHALGLLDERGVLSNGPPLDDETPAPLAETLRFLAATSHGEQALEATRTVVETLRLALVGSGPTHAELSRLLRLSGVRRLGPLEWDAPAADSAAIDLAIVVPGPSEVCRLEAWNELVLATGTPWMQVLPFDGRLASIGPVFVPETTCCYVCYRMRRRSNLEWREEFDALERVPAGQLSPPALVATLAGLAATVALRWAARLDRVVPGAFYALEVGSTLSLSLHRVLRVPRCRACSSADRSAAPLPWFKEPGVAGG